MTSRSRPTSRPVPRTLAGRSSFTRAEGRAAGMTDWDLDGGSLRRPTHGVLSARPAPAAADVEARCRELVPALPPGTVFSHVTALDLLGVDRPRGLLRPGDIHVQVPPGTRTLRRQGVRSSTRSTPLETVVLSAGLRVLPPDQLWIQLATELSADELVVLGDAMLRRQGALTTLADLGHAADGLPPGTRGRRRVHGALPRLRQGTDSCQETRLRLALVDGGLPCPEVNRPVVDAGGRFVALPDLSYPDRRVAVEYDGDVHRTDARTWRRDIARRQALEHGGWRLITCTADDVRAPDRALTWIRAALARSPHRATADRGGPGELSLDSR